MFEIRTTGLRWGEFTPRLEIKDLLVSFKKGGNREASRGKGGERRRKEFHGAKEEIRRGKHVAELSLRKGRIACRSI